MKTLFFFLLFLGISASGFAQYGRLEPLKENDTTFMVLRTPKETLNQFAKSEDKNVKKLGAQIESVERQLEYSRSLYLTNRVLINDMNAFLNTIKSLAAKGVNVSYYVQEMLFYRPKDGN